MIGEFVLVRTRNAGVHYGTLRRFEIAGEIATVELTQARRLWHWQGARTLHEISLHGVKGGSKVSEAVERIVILGVIDELFPGPAARRNLETARWDD
jgi:hypothetical protein